MSVTKVFSLTTISSKALTITPKYNKQLHWIIHEINWWEVILLSITVIDKKSTCEAITPVLKTSHSTQSVL